jgi:transposase InsO family protein
VNAVGERLEGKPHEPFDGGAEETRWSRPVARLRSTLPGTSGSEGGSGKPTNRKAGGAPRPDPYTYVATWSGFVYVALVIDAFSRMLVGWQAARSHPGWSSCEPSHGGRPAGEARP